MRAPGHGRAPAARSWLGSLVLVVALTAYVGHAVIQLRRAVRPAASPSPSTTASAPRESGGRDK